SANMRGYFKVGIHRSGSGEVTSALRVLDADEDVRTHGSIHRQDLHEPRHVEEILSDASVGHVKHRQAQSIGVFVSRRYIHIDPARLTQYFGVEGECIPNDESFSLFPVTKSRRLCHRARRSKSDEN